MERVEIFNIMTVAVTLLAIVPKMESQIRHPVTPRPLCASQFSLVNYACGRLPFTVGVPPAPLPSPPSPPSPDDDGGGDDEQHRNHHNHQGHGHRHRHRHRHHPTPDEDNCCRWAKEVDNQCVCEILLHLPPFLIRPLHQYTLIIGDDCEVTYSCGGPI